MAINHYLRQIGRGHRGARPLSREHAADAMGQILDGSASDLEVGGFCLAMRVKGETVNEMLGFLDALDTRMLRLPASVRPLVSIPSYNGARKLPVLTPLLALLLAREGHPVLIHGCATEVGRVHVQQVLELLGVSSHDPCQPVAGGAVAWVDTGELSPALHRLLRLRLVLGLRNSGHSMAKLIGPCHGPMVLVSSYTHGEYQSTMAQVLEGRAATAVLLRGTEGEPVADARRLPALQGYAGGHALPLREGSASGLELPPGYPTEADARTTAAYISDAIAGRVPVPAPIAAQAEFITTLARNA